MLVVVQTAAFQVNPYAGGTSPCWWYILMLVVPMLMALTPKTCVLPLWSIYDIFSARLVFRFQTRTV